MRARKNSISCSVRSRRDRLVRREHEFLDHLMTLVVTGKVRSRDLAGLAQLNRDLGQRKLESALLLPATAKNHRQVEHRPQHLDDFGGDVGVRHFRMLHDLEGLLVSEAMVDPDCLAPQIAWRSRFRRE